MQLSLSRVESYGGVELDASRIAKRKWLFQLIENQAIGTVEKVIAMQRVMDALIVEQTEFDKLHVCELAFQLPAGNEALTNSAFARMKEGVERIARHPYYPGKEKLVTEALRDVDQAVLRANITLGEKHELYRILGSDVSPGPREGAA